MTDEPQDLRVENSLLRGNLYLTARVLKDYHDAKHTKIDDTPMLQLTVHEMVRNRAADALARADKILKEPEQGRTR